VSSAKGTTAPRTGRRGRGQDDPTVALPEPSGFADWPDSVRIVGSQPSLWWSQPEPEPAPAAPAPGVVRLGPEAVVVGGELALGREVGQSFALMGLMALLLTLFVGLGLLAVRMLV
jgi:hypothetical protein